MPTVVIDPGHGGTSKVGGSSANNATSASGVLEKDICLDIAKRLSFSLRAGSGSRLAAEKGLELDVVMTRDDDSNLGLSARASVAAVNDADVYISIHCNGFNGSARGTECWIDRKFMQAKRDDGPGSGRSMPGPGVPSSGLRNVNVDADAAFAKLVVDEVLAAFKHFDSGAKLRTAKYSKTHHGETYTPPPGVKMMGLGTLRDAKLGTTSNECVATLVELEFIDHPKVDAVLNGATANEARNRIAGGIARAIVNAL